MWEIGNKSCTGCGACENRCPSGAIHMKSDIEGFFYPVITEEKCTQCRVCVQVCPQSTSGIYEGNYKTIAYAVMAKDEKLRMKSSSGGIFSLLAENVLNEGGVVFGAAFDEKWSVHHIMADTAEELAKLRGAKYVQSRIENTFSKAKDMLKEGRKVLFSGTPCQISGLQSYLGKEYSHLLCVDIVCHGVPSPFVWEKYLGEINKDGLCGIDFRNKKTGWSRYRYSLRLDYRNSETVLQSIRENPFLNGYNHNLFLRHSCGNCNFKFSSRKSDITLGDFWGIWNHAPEMDDDKGTSLVFVHTEKGKRQVELLKEKIMIKEMDMEESIKANPSVVSASVPSSKRNKFFKRIKYDSFNKTVSKNIKGSIVRRLWKYMERIFLSQKKLWK